MNNKIIRTKSRAEGGITQEEEAQFKKHSELWIERAMRTDPIEPEKIIPAIEGLYECAGLEKPRVVIVTSPLVMAFAYGASAAIWYNATRNAIYNATDNATRNAIYNAIYNATGNATYNATRNATGNATRNAIYNATGNATDNAIYNATDNATYNATGNATRNAIYNATGNATRNATRNAIYNATDNAIYNATGNATYNAIYNATDNATRNAIYNATRNAEGGAAQACFELAGDLGFSCSRRWSNSYQGGNMWAGYDCYLTACRDIIGLELKEHAAYEYWEQATIHGGFRILHEKFCLVCDFPEIIKKDDENRPHCEDGPSHKWRDGWSLYYWHGTQVPAEWIEDTDNINPTDVLACENVEQRAAGCQIIGWSKMLDHLDHKIIDSDPDPERGDLIEVTLDGLPEPEWYLRFYCPRNGLMIEGVNKRELKEPTVFAAQAWKSPFPDHLFSYPENRS